MSDGSHKSTADGSSGSDATNPMHTSIILDNNHGGYLRRYTKTALTSGLHRKRYYRLDGSVLSKKSTETSAETWHANILGATIVKVAKLAFSIKLSDPSTKAEDSVLILYAKSEDDCKKWLQCLDSAATRSLERHYQIGELIGEGGFATVRLGQHRTTQQVVAIKTMRKEQEYMQLYGREIAVIKRVDHPNIVRTYDLFETDKKIHIVMEYMRGGMLFEAIEDGIDFPEVDVAQLLREVLHGMMYLHKLGVVHRDIKPENVLTTDTKPPWHVKIADFGLSKFVQKGASSQDMLMNTLIGTPEFIAPEMANRQNYTSKVDIWAVGMLMYNVVTGKLPFDDDEQDFVGRLRKGLQLNFPEPQWDKYSEEAKLFTRALLCPDPDKRLTALGALVHPWLDDAKRFGSKKFSPHGRFSTQVTRIDTEGGDGSFLAMKPRKSVLFNKASASTRDNYWAVAFIAVRATNRFMELARPGFINPLEVNIHSSRRHSSRSASVKDSQVSGVSLGSELDVSDDDTQSSSFRFSPKAGGDESDGSSKNFGSMMRSMQQKSSRGDSSPTSSPKEPLSATKRLGQGLSAPIRKASGLASVLKRVENLDGPARKGSGLSSLLGLAHTGPERKESKLASIIGAARGKVDGGKAAAGPAAATKEFDALLGLGDLGVENIDETGDESSGTPKKGHFRKASMSQKGSGYKNHQNQQSSPLAKKF